MALYNRKYAEKTQIIIGKKQIQYIFFSFLISITDTKRKKRLKRKET